MADKGKTEFGSLRDDMQSGAPDPLTKGDFLKILESDTFFRIIGNAIKPFITGLSRQVSDLKSIAEKQHRRITQLESAMADQQDELDELKKQLISREHQEKIKNIKITGINCEEKNAQQAVREFVNDKLGIALGAEEYSTRPIFQSKKGADWPRPGEDETMKAKPHALIITLNHV